MRSTARRFSVIRVEADSHAAPLELRASTAATRACSLFESTQAGRLPRLASTRRSVGDVPARHRPNALVLSLMTRGGVEREHASRATSAARSSAAGELGRWLRHVGQRAAHGRAPLGPRHGRRRRDGVGPRRARTSRDARSDRMPRRRAITSTWRRSSPTAIRRLGAEQAHCDAGAAAERTVENGPSSPTLSEHGLTHICTFGAESGSALARRSASPSTPKCRVS